MLYMIQMKFNSIFVKLILKMFQIKTCNCSPFERQTKVCQERKSSPSISSLDIKVYFPHEIKRCNTYHQYNYNDVNINFITAKLIIMTAPNISILVASATYNFTIMYFYQFNDHQNNVFVFRSHLNSLSTQPEEKSLELMQMLFFQNCPVFVSILSLITLLKKIIIYRTCTCSYQIQARY